MAEFIGEEIEVEREEKPGPPTSIKWRGVDYRLQSVRNLLRRLDFKRKWYQRRHRDHYIVTTEDGETFEIYFNKGPGRRYWVLFKKY